MESYHGHEHVAAVTVPSAGMAEIGDTELGIAYLSLSVIGCPAEYLSRRLTSILAGEARPEQDSAHAVSVMNASLAQDGH